jgi:hypothetical protein
MNDLIIYEKLCQQSYHKDVMSPYKPVLLEYIRKEPPYCILRLLRFVKGRTAEISGNIITDFGSTFDEDYLNILLEYNPGEVIHLAELIKMTTPPYIKIINYREWGWTTLTLEEIEPNENI